MLQVINKDRHFVVQPFENPKIKEHSFILVLYKPFSILSFPNFICLLFNSNHLY